VLYYFGGYNNAQIVYISIVDVIAMVKQSSQKHASGLDPEVAFPGFSKKLRLDLAHLRQSKSLESDHAYFCEGGNSLVRSVGGSPGTLSRGER
jgi:hypothetical protein